MARNLIRVILNEVKNLDLSVGPKGEILRLRLRMTLCNTASTEREG
jgi:hypothetical protein